MLFLAVIAAGCKKEDVAGNGSPALPEVAVSELTPDLTSVSFSVTLKNSDEVAFLLSPDEVTAEDIFAEGESPDNIKDGKAECVIENLDPYTSYKLHVVSSVYDGEKTVYSKVVSTSFETKDYENVITVMDATKSSYRFLIKAEEGEEYKYVHLTKKFLQQLYEVSEANDESEKEMARMRYLSYYGFKTSGRQEFNVYDGQEYTDVDGGQYVYEIYGGTEYVILAVFYGDDGKFAEPVYMESVLLPEPGESSATVECSVVGEPSATDVMTLCEPSDNVLYYKQLVMEKAKADEYIAEQGLSELKYMVANDDRSTRCVGRTEDHWQGLKADTEYVMYILAVDTDHNQLWKDDFVFRTAAPEPAGEVELIGAAGDPSGYYSEWNCVNYTVKSEDIMTPSWYYFGQTSVVERLLNQGMTYEQIAEEKGVSIIPVRVNQINSETGWQVLCDGLRPDVSYTMFVVLTHASKELLVKRADVRTAQRPLPDASDSPLFSELLGNWTATCTADVMGEENTLTFDISITDGGEFKDMCRPYNRLMCTGFAGIEYKSPEDLRNDTSDGSYWTDVPEDIYYDFGPKWFLEIDKDGNVSLPTDEATVPYLMNYDPNALPVSLAVTGAYLTRKPCPVEVSPDRNTITVKPYYDEYMMMNFYLCMVEDLTATVVLKSDLVLTRK